MGCALVVLLFAWAPAPAVADGETRAVTLRWRAAPGPEPLGFVVVVGEGPGRYERTIPVGLPEPVDDVYAATVELPSAFTRYVAVLAYNSAGPSPPSNERVLPAVALPDPGRVPMIALGHASPGATIPLVSLTGGRYERAGSAAPTAGQQVAWCNLDGDATSDLVLGQAADGAGEIVVLRGAPGAPRSVLATAAGAGRPACGDLDGDGRDEIAVGLPGATPERIQLFDDALQGFAPLVAPPLDAAGRLVAEPWREGAGDGAATPAFGDLDGDGRDELVIALESGSEGYLRVLDDLDAGLAPFHAGPFRDGWLATRILAIALWPALGDLDADGRDELVVGFGLPGHGAWVRVVDDPVDRASLPIGEGWLPIAGADGAQGSAHPSLGDLDGDGAAELVVGFDDASVLRVFTGFTGTPRPFGDDGWVALAAHELVGPVFPSVRGPTHRVELPRILLAGGPVGTSLPWVRIDGSRGVLESGGLASSLPALAAACDTTGTRFAELLVGFGPGGGGDARLAFFDDDDLIDAFPLAAGPDDYAAANGELRPACGDLDGDGLDELVFGPGAGGDGYLFVHDDAYRAAQPWPGRPDGAVQWTRWSGYRMFGGGARPALGDVDGDGRDEIVIGLDLGGGGWIHVRDDATTGFAPLEAPGLVAGWLRWSSDAAYVAASGASRPALGDVDGDGIDEIAIGVDAGGGGHVALLDDAHGGFRALLGLQSSESGIRIPDVGDGSTYPLLLDVDADGRAELVVGFGGGASDVLYVADDALGDFGPHPATADGFLGLPPGLPSPVAPAAGAP